MHTKSIIVALVAMLALAGAMRAQEPGPKPEQERTQEPEARQEKRTNTLSFDPGGILAPTGGSVAVVNVPGGVELHVKADEAEQLEKLQAQVDRNIEHMKRMAERFARWRERNPEAMAGTFYGLVDKLTVTVSHIETGSIVRLLAQDEGTVATLQENASGWVEQAVERRERMAAFYRQAAAVAELKRMIAEGEVEMVTKQTDDGLEVRFTADDPAIAAKLRETLPEYFKQLSDSPRRGGKPEEDDKKENSTPSPVPQEE